MPKRLIVTEPPPRPTPVIPAAAGEVQSKAQEIAQQVRLIPGVQAFAIRGTIKVRISGNNLAEIAQKIMQLPEEVQNTPTKTVCDSEPIRIT
jgi:hypothetical protein